MRMRLSQFYCTKCGNRGFDIPRKENKQRPSGHLKKLYCIHCHEDTNHAEVRHLGKYMYQDFLCEFNNGNFDEDGNRIITIWKVFIDQKKKEGLY